MLLDHKQQTQLETLEDVMRREWEALLSRLSPGCKQAMRRLWERLLAHALAGCEAELAPYDRDALRHFEQGVCCMFASLELIEFTERHRAVYQRIDTEAA